MFHKEMIMREIRTFGKRQTIKRPLPDNKTLQEVFGVVNKGCDSRQVVKYIRKTTNRDLQDD